MPTITKIDSQKNNKDRYSIYVDGSYAFPVSLNVLSKFDLKKDQELTPELKEEIINEETYDKYLSKALDFLNYKIRTKKEIEDRLYRYLYKDIKDKAVIEDLHNRIINQIEDMGLIDDGNYASAYVEGKKLKSSPPGRYKIQRFLLKKGVDKKIIEKHLNDYSQELELKGAKEYAEKKMRKLDAKAVKDKKKLWDYLYRKGYSSDVIRAIVDSYFKV